MKCTMGKWSAWFEKVTSVEQTVNLLQSKLTISARTHGSSRSCGNVSLTTAAATGNVSDGGIVTKLLQLEKGHILEICKCFLRNKCRFRLLGGTSKRFSVLQQFPFFFFA